MIDMNKVEFDFTDYCDCLDSVTLYFQNREIDLGEAIRRITRAEVALKMMKDAVVREGEMDK